VLKALAERNNLDPALVEDVIMGCVMQVGNQSVNVGRSAVLAAGWPDTVPATTIDRQCGSSQQSAHFAAQGVMAGAYDIVVAAGVEVMSTTPMGASVTPGSFPMGPKVMERYAPVGGIVMQGTSAEIIAKKWDISREDSTPSRCRATSGPPPPPPRAASTTRSSRCKAKRFDRETGKVIELDEMVTADEGIRPDSSLESLAKLKPAFEPENGGSPPPTPRRSPTAPRPC
jgi:acetyl-CoA acyltransferase